MKLKPISNSLKPHFNMKQKYRFVYFYSGLKTRGIKRYVYPHWQKQEAVKESHKHKLDQRSYEGHPESPNNAVVALEFPRRGG